jgi:hypothetical protein
MHIARESTGEYWKPGLSIHEGTFEVLLLNTYYTNAVPGSKIDMNN